jgi:hypothetical protein
MNENAGKWHGQKKEPFLNWELEKVDSQNIFLIERPNSPICEKVIPIKENRSCDGNGNEKILPFFVKIHSAIK